MRSLRTEIKWGIIFILMGLVWMLLERLFGLHSSNIERHPIYTNFIVIPSLIIYYLALRDKREKDYYGRMSYWQGIKAGLWITLVVTICTPLSQIITSWLITPHYFENVIAYTVGQGMKTQIEAEQYFNLGNYIVQSVMFVPVMGILTSLILAIFTRKS